MSKWRKVRIDEAADVVSGGTPSRDNPSFWGAGTPWATPSDISRCATTVLSETSESITDVGLASSSAKRLPIGTILLTSRATIGAARIAGVEICTNQGFKNLVPKPGFDPTFLYYQVCRLRSQFERFGVGSTFAEINKRDVSQVEFDCPETEDEQERIGRVLRLTDDQIEQTEALIAKQERIRAGLLQDLFTRGVDQNGALRPPREEAPDLYHQTELGWLPKGWEAVRIDQLARNLDGRRIPLKDDDRQGRPGTFPYYGASGIIDWIDDYIFEGDFVLLGEDGANVLTRNSPLAFRASGQFWVNNHAHVFEPFPSVDIDFLETILEFTDYATIVLGSAQPKISQTGLRRLFFPRPGHDEQREIAKLVKALRTRDETDFQELHKLRALKSALMQDLLTGRVCVAPLLQAQVA